MIDGFSPGALCRALMIHVMCVCHPVRLELYHAHFANGETESWEVEQKLGFFSSFIKFKKVCVCMGGGMA